MKPYFDNKYSVMDDTLICCADKDVSLHISPDMAGGRVRKLGKGCFEGNELLENVLIDEGITNIDERAFGYCPKLTDVHIKNTEVQFKGNIFSGSRCLRNVYLDVELTEEELETLMSVSRRALDGRWYVLDNSLAGCGLDRVNALLGEMARNRQHISREIPALFFVPNKDGTGTFRSIADPVPIIFDDAISNEFPGSKQIANAFAIIRGHMNNVKDVRAEQLNDENRRLGKEPLLRYSAIISFSPDKAADCKAKKRLTLSVWIGGAFWLCLDKVIVNGKTYYVFIRNYLYNDRDMGYLRKEEGVVNEQMHLVKDKELADKVRAKHSLLAML